MPKEGKLPVINTTNEQIKKQIMEGNSIDRRTDVWAFGAVLYECLTGRRAFQGETVTETLAGILKGEPGWNSLPQDVLLVSSPAVSCLHEINAP